MRFFIENTRLVILITFLLIFLGVRGLKNLQRETMPPVDFATAVITTVYPGSSAKEVEDLITKKIEDEIRSTPHLKDVNSVSKPGLSQIVVRIDMDNTDTQKVINELSQSLQNIKGLPPEVLDPPRLTHIDAAREKSVLNLYISGSNENRQKDQYAWTLKNQIENLEDVLAVNLSYYKKREFVISLSTEKMNRWYISSNDVVQALQKQNKDFPAGYLESEQTSRLTRLIGSFRSVEELENIVIRSNFAGQSIRIKDIAEVKDYHEKEQGRGYIYSSQYGENFNLQPSVSLSVLKNLNADIISLIEKVNQKITLFKKQLENSSKASSQKVSAEDINLQKKQLTKDDSKKLKTEKTAQAVKAEGAASQSEQSENKIITGFDASKDTKKRLASVINNTLLGLVLIFIVFFIFLPSRIGFMASLSLPLSILAVFCLLPFMGVSFNVMTMLAFVICIGMLVDNSVVVSEYYARLTLDEKISGSQAAQKVIHQFFKPITATVLTTVMAFLPMLVTKGVMGEFIKWIPIVVTLALLMSLFESFCLLPNRLQWLPQKKPSFYQKAILDQFNKLEERFSIFLSYCLYRKYLTLGSIGFLILITGFLFKFGSQVDLFSSRSPEFYTAKIELKPNLSLELKDKETLKIAEKMQSVFKGGESIDWMSVQSNKDISEIILKVKPSVLRRLNYKGLLKELRQIEKTNFIKKLDFNIIIGGPPVGKALNVAFLSNDREEIKKFIDPIYPEISQIEGLLDLAINPDKDIGTEYRIRVKEDVLAKLGLDFRAVGLALRTALEGVILTEITEKNESFYIRVKHNEEELSSLSALKNIKVKEFMGRQISLGNVLDIEEQASEPDRKTYNFSPVLFLQANVDRNKSTSIKVNNQVQKIIDREIGKYPSVTYKLIGEQETTSESLKSLFQASGIAFFAILIILIVLFKSFVLSFLILSCIPLGLIGVIWSFFLHGRSLNFFALIGVVGLAGVVVNSAIILISFILRIRKEEPEKNLKDVVISASKIRLRPILITNLTTLGGLFPTAYGFPSFEPLLMPMTLALFWGLLTATLLTLIWVPCFYLVIEDLKSFLSRKKIKK